MYDQIEFDRQLEENRRFYEEHAEEIRTKYVGQYVGIAFGRLIAVDPDYFHVCRIVDGLEPPSLHHLVFQGGSEPAFEPVFT